MLAVVLDTPHTSFSALTSELLGNAKATGCLCCVHSMEIRGISAGRKIIFQEARTR